MLYIFSNKFIKKKMKNLRPSILNDTRAGTAQKTMPGVNDGGIENGDAKWQLPTS